MKIFKDTVEEMIRQDMYKYREGNVARVDKFMATAYWKKVFADSYRDRVKTRQTQADWDLFIKDMC